MFSEVPGPQQGVSFLLGVPESGGSRHCSEALGHQLHRVAQGWV